MIYRGLPTISFLVLDVDEPILKATSTQWEPASNGIRPGDLAHAINQCRLSRINIAC